MRLIHHQRSFSDQTIEENQKALSAGTGSLIIMIALVISYYLVTKGYLGFMGIFWIIVLIIFWRKDRIPLLRELRWAERGSSAEAHVVQLFKSKLDDSYTYICNYTNPAFSGGDIDGILIGPTGVFVIEVKNWQGSFRVSGPDIYKHLGGDDYRLFQSPIDQVNLATDFIKKSLGPSVPIRPFVIFQGYVKNFRGSTGVFIGKPEKVLEEIIKGRSFGNTSQVLDVLGVKLT